MSRAVFSEELVAQVVEQFKITNLAEATIGQVVLVAQELVKRTGIPFIRMDQGVPGLLPNMIGLQAEHKALDSNCAAIYPAAEGVPELKEQTSRFVKAFINIDINPESCIPVTGSVAGSFGAFIALNQREKGKDTVLFIDPGFPIQKSQLAILGIGYEQFDIYEYRGQKLREKLESFLCKGNISTIVYSNPNNPAWICLEDEELKIIGELATKYDVVVLEDLAYFEMDFRKPLGKPFTPPFQVSVANYTDNYILMLSASKIFSYAGQRIATLCVSDRLFERRFPDLGARYNGVGVFGPTLINAILYMITSGCTHTTQFALAEMFKAACNGELSFTEDTKEYAHRAKRMKELFEENGFYVVYDKDVTEKIGDGFFFTIGYPGLTSGELMRELLYYGISSITLNTTGSEQHGIRACTSRMTPEMFPILEERLKAFKDDHRN